MARTVRLGPTVAVLVAVLALGSGCGAGDDEADAGDAAAEPSTQGSATPEEPVELPDPCEAVTDREASRILGGDRTGELIEGDGATEGAVTCAFGSGEAVDDPSLDVIVTDASGVAFDVLVESYSGFDGVEQEDLEVDGADDAALLVEEDDLLDSVTALVVADDVAYTVLGSAPDVAEARRVAIAGAEAALAD